MKALGLLQKEMLIDERVEHLLGQPHLRDDLGRERLPVHLLVVLLHVIERAIELAGRDGLAVHPRRVGTLIDRSAVGTTGAPVDENEEDEDRNNGDQDPFEVLKAIAHQLEHVDEPLS